MLCPAGIVSPMRTKMVIDLITRVQLRPTKAKTEWLLDKIVMETTRPRLGAEPWRPIAQRFHRRDQNFGANLCEPRPMKCDVKGWRRVISRYSR